MSVEAQYEQLLQFETPVQIADFLRVHGVKGYKGIGDSCPIANYLKWDNEVYIDVDGEEICWEEDPVWWDSEEEPNFHRLPVTEAMRSFISRFDQGEFDDLMIPVDAYI